MSWAMVILRWIVIFSFAGWAGAAAAHKMWGGMLFFILYAAFVFLTGRYADRMIARGDHGPKDG